MSSTVAAILQRAVEGGRLSFDEGVDAVPRGRPARPRPRRRRRLPAAASRAVPHLQHRPQHQLHQRLHGGLRLLRVLPQGRRHRSLRARPRRPAREDPRDRRPRRRPDPDAGRAASPPQARVVRGAAPRHQGALPRRSTSTASARRRSITSPRSPSCRSRTVLERLKDAGLGSLPGGGAEILVDRVRKDDHARQGADRRLAATSTASGTSWAAGRRRR